jgi:hypothetical protein
MDNSLKDLENRLEALVPKGLSDNGRERCSNLIDRLSRGELIDDERSADKSHETLGVSWKVAAAAASIALGVGLSGGWMLGSDKGSPVAEKGDDNVVGSGELLSYEVLNSETWLSADEAPKVYFTNDGEVRELFSEVAFTKELVKDRGTGKIITLETTDHHLIDSVKSEF